jgi:DNA-binding HxlR family transcriptional regulator
MLNLDAFDKLDKVIHEKGRMAIMSLLAASESLSFKELKELLRMTDGNLSVHMRTLEESGYVEVSKSFVNRKPRTEYSLTPEGRESFQQYLRVLEEIVRQSQGAQETLRSGSPDVALLLRRGMVPAK